VIKILRPCREANVVSARVFDALFTKHLEQICSISLTPLLPWCDAILGPVGAGRSFGQSAKEFSRVCKGYHFFCPGHECIALAPLFLALRNEAKANIRLLFIAHAPGNYVLQWALFRHLMAPGDLIVAPSQSCRKTIEFLSPELSPFIRVIHHPMEPLSRSVGERKSCRRIVSLVSIHESKLIHRQIEAMALLRQCGHTDLAMDIAGPLDDFKSGSITPYARSLIHKIRRFGLEDAVRLAGPVIGEAAKAKFIVDADLMVNLSVNTEEAFPKSSIEALGMGVPVLATRWNGFTETVGEAGILVPVRFEHNGRADISAGDVAKAIEAVLRDPPAPAECIHQASRFLPESSLSTYRDELERALLVDPSNGVESAARLGADPEGFGGLLGKTAILQAFSPAELILWHHESADNVRADWAGEAKKGLSRGELIADTLLLSTQQPVEQFLGQIPPSIDAYPCGPLPLEVSIPEDDFFGRVARGILSHSTQRSKEACLLLLYSGNMIDLLEVCLPLVRTSTVCDHLRIELDLHRGRLPQAKQLFEELYGFSIIGEKDAYKLRQLARIYRKIGNPAQVLPILRSWLEHFPDDLESGVIWLELAISALDAGSEFLGTAEEAAACAKELLGPIDVISVLEKRLFRLQAMNLFA
jgi:glycosyltransferase involved in cell wall biosynthesis